MSIGNIPQGLSQAILVGRFLVGRLGVRFELRFARLPTIGVRDLGRNLNSGVQGCGV